MTDKSPLAETRMSVFPDTNVFLHFERLDNPKWLGVFPESPVLFVVVSTVVAELNEKKEHPRSKLRQRARAMVQWLLACRETQSVGLENGCYVEFAMLEPHSVLASKPDLDESCKDDRIIAAVLQYRQDNPNHKVAIVSDDAGLILKAPGFGLETIRPSDSLRLPDTKTEEDVEIEELRKALATTVRREPELKLRAATGESFCEVSIGPPPDDLEEYVKQRVADERQIQLERPGIGQALSSVEEYLAQYESWVRSVHPFCEMESRAFRLRLHLWNGGTCPGNDAKIYLEWDGSAKYLRKIRGAPQRPIPPIILGDMDLESLMTPNADLRFYDLAMSGNLNQPKPVRGPFGQDGSKAVSYEVDRIQHQFQKNLPSPILCFESFEAAANFTLKYRVFASNLPKETCGEIGVKVATDRDKDGLMRDVHNLDPSLLGWKTS